MIRRNHALALVVVALATCAAYWPALGGQMLWDDDAHVPKPEMRSVAGLARMWVDVHSTQQYYPLLFSWFWLQHRLWGDQMLGYHLANLSLHLGASFLVYTVLRRLKIPGALFAAGIFALHPVHVESVAWITEQKNTLSAVLYLGALLAYLYFDEHRRRTSYLLALVLFAAALLSKTVTVTLPPALLIVFWWQRGRLLWRRDVLPLVPLFLLSTADGLLTAWLEQRAVVVDVGSFHLSIVQRVLLAGRVFWFYLGKLLWPQTLMFIYPRWQIEAEQAWQWLFPLAAAGLFALCWMLRSRSRGPLAALLFYTLTLFPVLGFFNVYFFRYSFVSDHFPYLASLGPITLASAGVALLVQRLRPNGRLASAVAAALLLGILGLRTWQQSHLYGQNVAYFYERILSDNPQSTLAHNNLANWLADAGRFADAVEHYQAAIQIQPDDPSFHNNLGLLYARSGMMPQAASCFARITELTPEDGDAHCNLGTALTATGQLQRALDELQTAVRLDSSRPRYHNNLGNVYWKLGRFNEALAEFELALRVDPEYPEARQNLARLKARLQLAP